MPENEPNPHQQYLKANEVRLNKIVEAMNDQLAAKAALRAAYDPLLDHITYSKSPQVQTYMEQYGTSLEEAETTKHLMEKLWRQTLIGYVDMLEVVSANFLKRRERTDKHILTPGQKIFTTATYESTDEGFGDNDGLTIEKISIHNIKDIGEATTLIVTIFDDQINERFVMLLVGNEMVHNSITLHPVKDELMSAVSASFSEDEMKIIAGITMGIFETEEELDRILNNIRLRNMAKEDAFALDLLMQQIRERAINSKISLHMKHDFDITTPTTQKLNEILSLLKV